MSCVLFVGNGINRISDSKGEICKTECLLEHICTENNIENLNNACIEKWLKKYGFTICCETIISKSVEKDIKSYSECIEEKLKELEKISNNETANLYKELFKLKPVSYITTNYDYCFEIINGLKKGKALYSNMKYKGNATEYQEAENLEVYHIHGATLPGRDNKLCLGFRNYTRFMNSFFANLPKSYTKLENISKKDIEEIKNKLYKPFRQMLEHDTFILGFGLDSCEIDIWYFLTLRSKLISLDTNNTFNIKKIYFYQFCPKAENDEMQNNSFKDAKDFFKLYDIELISFENDKNIYFDENGERRKYPSLEFYERVIKDIKEKTSNNKN